MLCSAALSDMCEQRGQAAFSIGKREMSFAPNLLG
jgi:hypothetical protein